MRIIQIIGWYGKGNLGDDLFLEIINKSFPEWKIFFSDGDIHNDADLILLGPGDVLDEYYLRNYKGKQPIILFCVGLRGRKDVDFLSKFESPLPIYVRFQADYVLLKKMGFNVKQSADPVFSIIPTFREKNIQPGSKLGIILNDEINKRYRGSIDPIAMNAYSLYFNQIISRFTGEIDHSFWIKWIVFSRKYPNDGRMIIDVCDRVNTPILNPEIFIPQGLDGALLGFSDLQRSISMRLHGAILSLIAEKPCLMISQGRKMDLLYQDLSLDKWLIKSDSLNWDRLESIWEDFSIIEWSNFIDPNKINACLSRFSNSLDEINEYLDNFKS